MIEHQHFEIGQQVLVLDRELVGTIIEIEHLNDYVLDDAAYESPKRVSFQVALPAETVWRNASELRAIPDDLANCVVTTD